MLLIRRHRFVGSSENRTDPPPIVTIKLVFKAFGKLKVEHVFYLLEGASLQSFYLTFIFAISSSITCLSVVTVAKNGPADPFVQKLPYFFNTERFYPIFSLGFLLTIHPPFYEQKVTDRYKFLASWIKTL
jgi:hypothetical protein